MTEKKRTEMYILLRILPIAFFIWVACYFFYSLGKRKALQDYNQKSRNRRRGTKVVESSVVEKENDTDDTVH